MKKEHLASENIIERQAVVIKIGDGLYLIDIMKIKEIIKPIKLTAVPKAPRFIEGVINLRGIVIPIIDMRKRFDLPKREDNKKSRIVILSIEKKIVGLIVDKVEEVIKINVKDIKPPPEMLEGVNTEFIFGVYKYNDDLLMVLKLDSLLTAKEKKMLKKK
jgi:purine-binding chemotaxis protein CheW